MKQLVSNDLTTKKIPHPPKRIPLLGDLLGIDSVNPNTKTLAQFRALGPIYRRTILGTDLTFVGSAEYAEAAFSSDWERFAGRPIERLREIGGDGLFTAENDSHAWTSAHDALMPAFSKEAMSSYHQLMQTTSENLAQALGSSSGPQVAQAVFARFAHEVIGQAGFGYSFGPDLLDNSHEFPAAMGRALTFVQKSSIPVVGQGSRRERKQYNADRELLFGTVREVINGRKNNGAGRHRDFLDVMLSANLPTENIEHQLLTFLIAGQETTASTLGFLSYEFGRRPDLRARALEEIASVLGDRAPTFEDVPKLRFLRACIEESLRLYPPAPGIFRRAIQQTNIGPYSFAEGEWVFVLLLAVHRDPAVWGDDAEEFNPDRFLSAASTARRRPAAAYKPFGTGIRSCIGRQFAQHEITVCMTELLRKLDWSVVSPSTPMEFDETLTLRPRNLVLEYSTRG